MIVCSDIVGYSALTAENEDDALTMMSVFHRQARRAAEQAQGRLVKTMGDGVLLEFKDPTSATATARRLAARSKLLANRSVSPNTDCVPASTAAKSRSDETAIYSETH